MGWAFVKRRMTSELGPGWEGPLRELRPDAGGRRLARAGASGRGQGGAPVAVKLQYPDMQSAVEADLNQLQVLFALHRRMDTASTPPRSSRRSARGCGRSWTTTTRRGTPGSTP